MPKVPGHLLCSLALLPYCGRDLSAMVIPVPLAVMVLSRCLDRSPSQCGYVLASAPKHKEDQSEKPVKIRSNTRYVSNQPNLAPFAVKNPPSDSSSVRCNWSSYCRLPTPFAPLPAPLFRATTVSLRCHAAMIESQSITHYDFYSTVFHRHLGSQRFRDLSFRLNIIALTTKLVSLNRFIMVMHFNFCHAVIVFPLSTCFTYCKSSLNIACAYQWEFLFAYIFVFLWSLLTYGPIPQHGSLL